MTITIFEKKNCRGDSRTISRDDDDLKGGVDKPSSIRLTSSSDKILLFKNDDWKGGVHYIRGPKTVENLGSARDGGRHSFGNSIRSVRVTPFTISLNVTIVRKENGDLPGNWGSQSDVETAVGQIVDDMNAFYEDERALLRARLARCTFRTDDRRFEMGKSEGVPSSWKRRGEIDVIFIDRFKKDALLGTGAFPCWGKLVRIAKRYEFEGTVYNMNTTELGTTLTHEIGHYLGLSHGTSNNDDRNLMFPSKENELPAMRMTSAQVREMHQRLARNIARKGDRG